MLTFLIPGIGQLVNKEYKKSVIGLMYALLEFSLLKEIIIPTLSSTFVYQNSGSNAGNYTIGAVEYQDDSFLILIGAAFSLLLLAVMVMIAVGFVRDYVVVANAKQDGIELPSLRTRAKDLAPDIIPHAVTVPYYLLMFMFLIIPAFVSIAIAFTNFENDIIPPAFLINWVGFQNFKDLISDPIALSAFTETLQWTIVWTVGAAMTNIVVGIFLAVITNGKRIKGKRFFRTIFILPWAIPGFLTILVFQIFFSKVGAMNTFVIPLFTGQEYNVANAIGFLMDPQLARKTILFVQAWLGFPYIYLLVTGILQAIPSDLYEAANIDGGNPWTNFWDITFPAIFMAASPIFIMQFASQFNNVTIFYLLGSSVVKPVGATYSPIETISSLGYQLTLDGKFATAAVYTLITSIVVSSLLLFFWIKTGAFKNEEVY
ncbi:MAG: ABC transporter permease subunit [Erysipelotrichaceae bacterium]